MQILINGLIQGLVLGLVAIGFSVIYNSTGILNIAQGAIYAITPYLIVTFTNQGIDVFVAIIITLTFAVLLSLFKERFNHWPLYKKGASLNVHFVSSLGIYIAVIQVIAIIWGNETKVFMEGIDITYNVWGVTLTRFQILGGVACSAIILLFFVWLRWTASGLMFMALSDNPIQLSLMGYNIGNLRLLAFGLSGLLTALASLLVAVDIGFDPNGGMKMILLAMIATIIGGQGTFLGPVIGGIFLGILRTQTIWYTSAKWADAISFLVLVVFLFMRPQGILGEKGRIEAQ